MTVDEMIKKFRLMLAEQNGQPAIKVLNKPTAKQISELRAAKPEIIAELQRREQEKKEREAKRQAELKAELEAIRSGEKKIELRYSDGEYLSGYSVYGQAADLLEGLGIGSYVSGWGYHVENKVVDALGTEFTYQQAAEYARPAIEAKAAAEAKREAERQAKFDEARESGKPVLLKKWMAPCNDPHEECSTDLVTQYAMPDGSVKTERQHTW